jgi:hypothetical protein
VKLRRSAVALAEAVSLRGHFQFGVERRLYSGFQLYVVSAFRRTEKGRLKPATTYNKKAL